MSRNHRRNGKSYITKADLESVAKMLTVKFVPLLEGEITEKNCWEPKCRNKPVLLAEGSKASVPCCSDVLCQIVSAICAHLLSLDRTVADCRDDSIARTLRQGGDD